MYEKIETRALVLMLKDERIAEPAREKIRAELETRSPKHLEPRKRTEPVTTADLEPVRCSSDAPGDTVSLVLFGPPRTKKTSNRVVFRGGKPKVLPSAAWCAWLAALQRTRQLPFPAPLPDRPYRCCAVFYRDRTWGDLVGFQQGLADVLEKGGVVSNDRWIQSWDGTRLDVDPACPRVEIEILPVTP